MRGGQTVTGPTISSFWNLDDTTGLLTVWGEDGDGALFYSLVIDPAADTDEGAYQFTMYQDIPVVTNPLDFSSVKAGGPQETLTVESIRFDGKFFTDRNDIAGSASDDLGTNSDDVNPNNAGGIGIGNGNVERLKALMIDTTGSASQVSGVSLEITGVGGGIRTVDLLWEAYVDTNGNDIFDAEDQPVASGSETADLGARDPHVLEIEPGVDFDFIFVAMDPDDVDGNDTARINNISTIQQIDLNDFVLNFELASEDGDDDWAPGGDPTQEVAFAVTIEGSDSASTNVAATAPGAESLLHEDILAFA
ncbi:hypothetical protein HMH01_04835 [Halovulum dunhuangense]|uniref:DUF5801 domain-containing protein n=1 Tax=Halovulum dunhuangense TaxID=1505036 RepID=A0A849L0H7_9RHOB|nr:hypothetical protein [Halovulum dunhuangense]NNU79763.1 hypothetical protein [Halovulum dunhuangense]